MGILIKQSLTNTAVTYLGFAFGALNTLFLYTQFLTPEYYGLVTFILGTGVILMPLMAFGTHNTLVKFYNEQSDNEKDGFLSLMLLLPLVVMAPIALILFLLYNEIGLFLGTENPIVKNYLWHLYLVGLAMAYFEVFFAWSKVHLKSVFGNFLKEVFVRVGVTILLLIYWMEWISLNTFFNCLVGLFLIRTIIAKLYAYSLYFPKLSFRFPEKTKIIIAYSALIILGGSASMIIVEIDKFMINQYLKLEYIAFYGVAVYIAAVIAVPSRAMHQISYPLTAKLLTENKPTELKQLYQRTSLTLFIASGLLLVLILLNLEDLYKLLPKSYSGGFFVVMLMGMAKVTDAMLGNNNAILYNSKYYKTILYFGVAMAILTILLNLWFIPKFELLGAALASFIVIMLFNILKLIFVNVKFGMLPFTKETFMVLAILLVIGVAFYFVNFRLHPLVNIGLKSGLIIAIYVFSLYRFQISEDIDTILSKFLIQRKK